MTSHRPALPRSRARLSLVLLLYFLGIVGVITLSPFRFAAPRHIDILTHGDWFDIVTNVLLFVPLGFLYPMMRGTNEPSPARVFLLGALLSAAIETTQLFEPERYSSVIDVMTNALGAAVGAVLLRTISRRIRLNKRLVGRLSLEIPLIGLIYLLIPLLIVASLSALEESMRLISLIPLGLLGARLMSTVQRHHFGPDGVFDNRAMGVVGAGWMLLGIFPVMRVHPLIGIGLAMLVGLATWYEARPGLGAERDRRFESETLRSAVPYVAVYVFVVTVLPLAAGIDGARFELGLTGSGGDLDQQMLRLLEPLAALTLLGYMLAEAIGRRELKFRAIAPRIAGQCACVAVLIEGSRAFQSGVGASGVQLMLMIAAGLLGAGIYHKQREHVRWIITERANTPVRGGAAVH